MVFMDSEKIRKAVREGYAKVATEESTCCGSGSFCCGGASAAEKISGDIGYSREEMNAVPSDSNLGLGCGNPTAVASLKEGEIVLDLGSGAGFDCFLAARKVGPKGKIIGVDMTPEMIEKARKNGRDYPNVEFRLGEIENLPAADNSVNVIISNCVINLVPDKARVFAEAFRVLKPGGRVMVSDIVLTRELPGYILKSVEAYVGCLSGAILKENYLAALKNAGFGEIKIVNEKTFPLDDMINDPTAQAIIKASGKSVEELTRDIETSFISINVAAVKPN
jgi:SAM-dependent methyltransferase